jgi:RNA polymerase sigma-54 factor
MKQNQFLQQKQALNLSQTLRQSINILQLSTFELAEYITKELEQNPLLLEKEPEKFSTQERHYTKHFSKDKEYNVVENAAYDKTLKQYLIEQIELITPDAEEKQIALYLADLVDENGYLTNDDLQVPDQ